MKDKILEWIAQGDTGLSSMTIAFRMVGMQYARESHPADPDDLNRCIELLNFIPAIRLRLNELSDISPEWKRLIANWGKIETTFLDETKKPRCHSPAPKTYKLMRKIIEE